tara:strand:+ start:596 stop:2512 length:1917 start_codon:yes stop_codon:yes gene_type:complete
MANPHTSGGGSLSQRETKTSFNPKEPGRFPGDYKVTKCWLISPTRGVDAPIDLQDNDKPDWTELNFYEDIYSPSISGDITINDAVGLMENVPIVGEEFLEISMSTAGATPSAISSPADTTINVKDLPKLIHNRFRVYKIDAPQKISENFRSIKLYFVSDIQYSNMMTRVQKNYPTAELTDLAQPENPLNDKTYTIADMVRDIFYDCFIGKKKPANHRPTHKNLLVEPTKGPYNASIPNWTPFKSINFLAKRAISVNQISQGANFVFYETLKGFRFVSIETLMVGGFRGYEKAEAPTKFPHYDKFYTEADAGAANTSFIPVFSSGDGENPAFTPQLNDPGSKGFVAVYSYKPGNLSDMSPLEKKYAVEDYHLVHSFDTLKNLGMGLYANRVITHDLVRMKWSKNDFHYIKPKDIVSFIDATTNAEVEMENPDKPAPDQKTKVDLAMKTDPGKVCSPSADMLGRPESHVTLYPTNEGMAIKFAEGMRSTTYLNSNGDVQMGGDFDAFTVHGNSPTKTPKVTDRKVEEWLAQRTSQKRQLETLKVQFSVPGDSAREVGDLIWFQYPSEDPTGAQTGGPLDPHKYYSGKFLITALRHKITANKEYTMSIEAIKDAYRSEISKGFKLKPPTIQSPDGTGGVNG